MINCINYLLTVAQHEVFLNFSTRLNEFGITPGQYGVLNCIWQNDSTTPKEIAQTLRLENSTVSGVLDRMQKRGLIDRVLDPNDRRSIQVVATDEGMSMKAGVLRAIEELNAEAMNRFSKKEWMAILDGLRKIGRVDEAWEDV